MISKDIGDYIIEEIDGFDWATNAFLEQIPADKEASLVKSMTVTTTGTDPAPTTWDGEMARVTIDFRIGQGTESHVEGYTIAKKAYDALHMAKDLVINGTRYHSIMAGALSFTGFDGRERSIWRFDISLVKGKDGQAVVQ